jgi:hypothetical protein
MLSDSTRVDGFGGGADSDLASIRAAGALRAFFAAARREFPRAFDAVFVGRFTKSSKQMKGGVRDCCGVNDDIAAERRTSLVPI